MKKENRLQQLVIADPTAAAKDPIWQLLHLEDKHFLRKQPGPLKLHLLGLLSEEDQETLEERLSGKEVPIDIFEIESCDYDDTDCFLETEFAIQEFSIKVFCYDTCAEMKDVDECDEHLPLADSIIAFLENKDQDLQEFAETCGIEYEPNMSPDDGYPMRPGGVSIESDTGFWEFEECSFPDDTALIKQLTQEADFYVLEEDLATSNDLRPLFSSGPSWDDDLGTEGSVSMSWHCESYIPIAGNKNHKCKYKKVSIDQDLKFSGNSTHDDYTLRYRYEKVGDLEDVLSHALSKVKTSDLIEDLLLRVLGLDS